MKSTNPSSRQKEKPKCYCIRLKSYNASPRHDPPPAVSKPRSARTSQRLLDVGAMDCDKLSLKSDLSIGVSTNADGKLDMFVCVCDE